MNNYKVYKYTNINNSKIYIGQTCRTLEERAGNNGIHYQGCSLFYRAIVKYGWKSFQPEILKDNLTLDEANYWEKYYISLYESTDLSKGYNILFGGNNMIMPVSVKKQISELAKKRYTDKTRNPMYGKTHSNESKLIMSNAKLGEKNPFYGKHHTEESKNKISKANKGKTSNHKVWTEEERQNASIKFKEYSKMWTRKVKCIEDNLIFNSVNEASQYYKVSKSTLSGHLHGNQKTCKGKHFEFIN